MAAVIGSGVSASRLSPDDVGLQLFENAMATGAALVAIILAFGPVSGAYLNPVVTAVDAARGRLGAREAWTYGVAQLAGGVAGAVVANLMFSLPAVELSAKHRGGAGMLLGELVATVGLVLVVAGAARAGRWTATAVAVGAYITGAYFVTSSTSFANPAVTVARSLSDTFAGIAPASVVPFLVMEIVGGALGYVLVRWWYRVRTVPPGET